VSAAPGSPLLSTSCYFCIVIGGSSRLNFLLLCRRSQPAGYRLLEGSALPALARYLTHRPSCGASAMPTRTRIKATMTPVEKYFHRCGYLPAVVDWPSCADAVASWSW
jgi:hypothetical protein